LNKKLAEISDRQGRLVEDIVAPSVPAVVAAMFDLDAENPLDLHFVRWKLRVGSETREIDVIAGFSGHLLVVEVKSTLRPGDVRDFVAALPSLRPFLPAVCADRKLIGAVASLHLDESLVRFAENQGLIVMGLGDHLMEAKNQKGFVPRGF
jgi:hypothetical protein